MGQVVELSGVADMLASLGELKTDGKRLRKDLDKIVRTVLAKARNKMKSDAKLVLGSDPRKAYQAVRHSVYRRMLGGQVNILNPRRVKMMALYRPPRKLRKGQRGGNRRRRSDKTNRIDAYVGKDRGFILRFINSGTVERTTRYGNRGKVIARNWFATSSTKALNAAAQELEELILRAIEEIWDEGEK